MGISVSRLFKCQRDSIFLQIKDHSLLKKKIIFFSLNQHYGIIIALHKCFYPVCRTVSLVSNVAQGPLVPPFLLISSPHPPISSSVSSLSSSFLPSFFSSLLLFFLFLFSFSFPTPKPPIKSALKENQYV